MQTSFLYISGFSNDWLMSWFTSICMDLQWIKALVIFFTASLYIFANSDFEIPICFAADIMPSQLICFSLRASISSWPILTTVGSLMPSIGCRIVRAGVKFIFLSFFFLPRFGNNHHGWYEKDVIMLFSKN